jgi:hypothetical protein
LVATPFFWWFLPGAGGISLMPLALGAAFAQGVANLGWAIGAGRLLFVNIVPPRHKVGYMAIYSACVGLIAGSSQVSSGYLIDIFQGVPTFYQARATQSIHAADPAWLSDADD